MHDDPAELRPATTMAAASSHALAEQPDGDAGTERQGGIRAARLATIRAEMAALLGRPDLSAVLVANRLGVTARYVRKLLAADGTRFSTEVHALRLAQVHSRLRDTCHAGCTIADLAFAAGFRDLATFNRRFRLRFGTTPSAVRAAAPAPDDRPAAAPW